jgi:hypothetical protein
LLQFFTGFGGFFVGDDSENSLSVDKFLGLVNNGVTDFSNKYNKSGRVVVESGFFVDHKNGVHNRDK